MVTTIRWLLDGFVCMYKNPSCISFEISFYSSIAFNANTILASFTFMLLLTLLTVIFLVCS